MRFLCSDRVEMPRLRFPACIACIASWRHHGCLPHEYVDSCCRDIYCFGDDCIVFQQSKQPLQQDSYQRLFVRHIPSLYYCLVCAAQCLWSLISQTEPTRRYSTRCCYTYNMRKNKNRPLSSRITGSNVLWSLLDKGSMAKHETLTGRYQAETNFLNKMFKKTINYYQ